MFSCDLAVRGGENGWASLPVIKMKINFFNKTSSFLIVLKFRKTCIQILKLFEKQEGHVQGDKKAHPGDKILCVLHLHYNVAFTFK